MKRTGYMQKEKDLISVILPIYNVAPYIEKCLESVIGQTYRNLEIILVDDGSTDGCGAICDRWAKIDPRIRVIHRENGGLSAARNTGVKASTGSWISYIDPDDWIGEHFIERLHENALKNQSDMVLCRTLSVSLKKGKNRSLPALPENRAERPAGAYQIRDIFPAQIPDSSVISGKEYMLWYLQGRRSGIAVSAWSKLYKRELAEAVIFPEGRVYEDLATMQEFAFPANRISECRSALYYHLSHRPGSITEALTKRKLQDYCWSTRHSIERSLELFPEYAEEIETRKLWNQISLWKMLIVMPDKKAGIHRKLLQPAGRSAGDDDWRKRSARKLQRQFLGNLSKYRRFSSFRQLQVLMICFLPGIAGLIVRIMWKYPVLAQSISRHFQKSS